MKGIAETQLDGSGLHIAIVYTRWNSGIVDALVKGAEDRLLQLGSKITKFQVSGSFELPLASKTVLEEGNFDACISIGVLIKGETMHFEYICESVSQGLMRVGLDTGKPVIFGVLTCLSESQAKSRAGIGANSHNHGPSWADAAVEMAQLKSKVPLKVSESNGEVFDAF